MSLLPEKVLGTIGVERGLELSKNHDVTVMSPWHKSVKISTGFMTMWRYFDVIDKFSTCVHWAPLRLDRIIISCSWRSRKWNGHKGTLKKFGLNILVKFWFSIQAEVKQSVSLWIILSKFFCFAKDKLACERVKRIWLRTQWGQSSMVAQK